MSVCNKIVEKTNIFLRCWNIKNKRTKIENLCYQIHLTQWFKGGISVKNLQTDYFDSIAGVLKKYFH